EDEEEEVVDWFAELWPRESQRELVFPVDSFKLTVLQDVNGETFKTSLANTVWEAGWFLNRYFQEKSLFPPGYFVGKSALELGSGTGVVGMTLALLGAEVTLTDLAEALPILRANVEFNFGEKGPRSSEHEGDSYAAPSGITVPEVEELAWGEPLSDVITGQHWDIVIGADIIYNPTHFEALASSLEHIMSN
ncbi:unnamed protein product, partial [Heterosigma akashiwo]